MTEWLKVRAWKVRIPQKGIVGSNPAFSAVRPARFFGEVDSVFDCDAVRSERPARKGRAFI